MSGETPKAIPWPHVETIARFLAGRVCDPSHLRVVIRDDQPTVLGCCPGCGEWAELDADQLHGIVSTHHDAPECGYHRVKNWWKDHTS